MNDRLIDLFCDCDVCSERQDRRAGPREEGMLHISRKVGESIMIGDDVRVEVLEIRGSKVRLGFDAPKEVAVNRREVWLRIQQGETNAEGQQADASTEDDEPDADLQV